MSADHAATIEIHTQVEAIKGRPDLEICTSHRLVWVEVKAESELRSGQLEGYYELLRASGFEETSLVLLTRYAEAYPNMAARPNVEVRWFELAHWIEEELSVLHASGEVAVFLAEQFLTFLKGKGMTLTQVEKYLPDGLRARGSFLNMLMEAANACKIQVRKYPGWDKYGLVLDGPKYWVGVDVKDPEKLWFATYTRINPQAAAQLGVGEVRQAPEAKVAGRNQWWWGVDLSSEDVHFFSRTKIGQMKWLEAFLRDCLTKAKSIETPDQPPIPEDPDGA